MELRALQYFVAVVEAENLSKAAEFLHVTQPTLSRQMQQLEEELNTTLFERGRHLTLTDTGRMLYQKSLEILILVDKVESNFLNQEEISGVISIGSGGLSASKILPELMAGFRKRYPKVEFQLYTNSADHIKERLEQGLLDFALLLEPIDATKFDYIRMTQVERWGLLVRRAHPLAEKEYITKEDLKKETLMVSDRASITKELEQWLGSSMDDLNIFARYNIITNVAMLVDSGVASALTIEGSTELFVGSRLVFKPLYPELNMTTLLAWKKFQSSFGAAAKFLEYIKVCNL